MDILVIRLGAKDLTTEDFLKKLEEIYPEFSIEMIEIKTTPPVQVVPWWTDLPMNAKLITLRETNVYKDIIQKIVRNKINKGDISLTYWGKIGFSDGVPYVKVWENPKLWVKADDVRPKG